MRAVRGTPEGIDVVDVAAPVTTHGEVLVRVERAGICGSDLHMIAEGFHGVTLGHEFAGRLADGARVAVRPTGECGTCTACQRGRTNLCASAFGAFHGGLIDGGWAEQVSVQENTVFRVPDALSAGAAALVEPLAVAVHGVRRIDIEPDRRIAVIGGGSVGLAAVAALRHRDHEVSVDARYEHQRVAAAALGADIGLSGAYDVVIDAVGTQSAVDASLRACRSGGTIIELGVFWESVTLGREMTLREISLVPALFYSHDHETSDFGTAIDIIARRPEIESIFVTHVFPLEDAAEAIRVAGDRSSGAIKVQLTLDT
jgi:threonine dehydrogenase-like Zn-dependent dehydrogenase